jgi:prohibitin 2
MNQIKDFLAKNKNALYASGSLFSITVGGLIIYRALFRVEPGYLAIKFSMFGGVKEHIYKEGYHFNMPFIERPIIYDCRMANYVQNTQVGTKDLQIVTLVVRIICRPKTDRLPDLYRLLGKDYDNRTLNSIIPEICGITVSQFTATQIISSRDTIRNIIKQRITEKAGEFFIDIDDVAIIDMKFSKDFSDAIEKKQVAQQEAERVKFHVEEALEEKKSTIIKALGESEAVRKFGEANQHSNAFLTLRKLETSKKISKVLEKSNNKIMLDSNSFFLNLPYEKDLTFNKSI